MADAEGIEVRAHGVIECPIDEVKRQYRDIDHHIRRNVHPGITFTWVEAEGGRRLTRTEFRLLGRLQHDLTDFVDGDDGVLRLVHLEGANVGTVVEHHFTPIGPTTTRVDLVARAPSTPIRRLFGPLFRFGVRQILLKALDEDKRDLEGAGYAGGAAGDVEGAVESFFARPPDTDTGLAVTRAACAVVMADGITDEAEADAIRRAARALAAGVVPADVDEHLALARAACEAGSLAGYAEAAGRALADKRVAAEGVGVAAVLGAVSQGLSYAEVEVLERLAAGAGLDAPTLEATLARAEAALSGHART